MVHMCNWIISPGFFLHFFKTFIFGVNSGIKEEKMAQNNKKLCVLFHISGSIHDMVVIFGTHV